MATGTAKTTTSGSLANQLRTAAANKTLLGVRRRGKGRAQDVQDVLPPLYCKSSAGHAVSLAEVGAYWLSSHSHQLPLVCR
jgi:hypothetical protein